MLKEFFSHGDQEIKSSQVDQNSIQIEEMRQFYEGLDFEGMRNNFTTIIQQVVSNEQRLQKQALDVKQKSELILQNKKLLLSLQSEFGRLNVKCSDVQMENQNLRLDIQNLSEKFQIEMANVMTNMSSGVEIDTIKTR